MPSIFPVQGKVVGERWKDDKNPTFSVGADKVIAAGQKNIRPEGPVPEAEIVEVHRGFWNN